MTQTTIIKGIVLSSCDYKEKDKLVEVFSLELGKITAVLKSCKSPNAKLKFAFQPFCFAEFSVIKIGKFYQIADAKLIDSFFDLTNDLSVYYHAMLAMELISIAVDFEEQSPTLFLMLLNTLKYLCYDKYPYDLTTLKFAEQLMENLGYKISFVKCTSCNMPYTNKVFLNLDSGEFVCSTCKNQNSISISNQAFSLLKIVNNTVFDRLSTIKIPQSVSKEAILILCKNLEHRLTNIIRSSKFI